MHSRTPPYSIFNISLSPLSLSPFFEALCEIPSNWCQKQKQRCNTTQAKTLKTCCIWQKYIAHHKNKPSYQKAETLYNSPECAPLLFEESFLLILSDHSPLSSYFFKCLPSSLVVLVAFIFIPLPRYHSRYYNNTNHYLYSNNWSSPTHS